MNTYAPYNYRFIKGEGTYLYDDTGKRYIDFGCGISVSNLGHGNPHLLNCLKGQADKLWHTSNLFPNKIVEDLAERISKASFGGKVFFCNSGAEANEGAIKLARIYNNKVHAGAKPRIITMNDGFHGRTYTTLSATAQKKVQSGFEPIAPFFTYAPYNDIATVESELSKGDVCAVMLELYQGESGVLPANIEYVKKLRELADKYKALLIFDEVQTGFGRTGKLFAYEHFGVTPDIMTMAKAIANGLPMGAFAAKPEIADLFTPGTHGSTFGGNLLACAVAHGVLDIMLADGFLNSVTEKGLAFQLMLKKRLEILEASVRGKGLMVGVELPILNKDFIRKALDEGLVLIAGGEKSVRFYPPLTATMDELEQGANIAEKVMRSFL
jgi:predicted acetylornithine/succinylornithine family transaminase